MIKGYDISAIQGSVDFKQLYANGIRFCIFRCGVGNDFIDSTCTKNLTLAKAANIKPAIYHFVYPLPTDPNHPGRDPISQAEYHYKASNGELAFIDIEWPEPVDFLKWSCTPEQIKDWCKTYLDHYQQISGGKIAGIYTYIDFMKHVNFDSYFAQYNLWLADYDNLPVPAPWKSFVIEQTGQEKLPNGASVDVDVMQDLNLIWKDEVVVDPPIVQAPVITPQSIINVAPVSVPVVQNPKPTQPASTNFNINEIEKVGGGVVEEMVKSSPLMLIINSVIGIVKKIFKIK